MKKINQSLSVLLVLLYSHDKFHQDFIETLKKSQWPTPTLPLSMKKLQLKEVSTKYWMLRFSFFFFRCLVIVSSSSLAMASLGSKQSPSFASSGFLSLGFLSSPSNGLLPPVDIFVTTADPGLEPPIMTVNTVLSLLAVDYPANKLACYVSDDGCSPITFYSLTEALKFAKIWVPFCKQYRIQVRAPFRFFSIPLDDSPEEGFEDEWRRMKDEYENLCLTIEEAAQTIASPDLSLEYLSPFSSIDSKNHPPIIKVIWENKESLWDGLPHLVYVSREKRPKHPHHYKAGAMNVLARVSGLMTNAGYILNVDCDMFLNNPNAILQAICPLFDQQIAFVQFPQCFYGGSKDDLYGNQFIVFMEYVVSGTAGIQGPHYMGTGCIHRRKVIYGELPNEANINGKKSENELYKSFGNSEDFIKSAASALRGSVEYQNKLPYSIQALNEVASCNYEYDSGWGTQVGWLYGSATEDIFTGMMIQKRGWKSIYLKPDPPAFLGYAPTNGPGTLTQLKRWATGFLEIFFSKNCPIFGFLFYKLHFRQCLYYMWVYQWALGSIPELCYAALPAYCLLTNSHFLPKVQESFICIPLLLFVLFNIQQLLQYLETGQSVRAWWNNQRMARVTAMCPYFFAIVAIILKLLGLSETMFEVTKKDSSSSDDDEINENSGQFTFDESPLFVPGTTVLMVQLTALSIGILGPLTAKVGGEREFGVGEVMCSVWLILCFWPFLKGMFAKGRYGLPWSTLRKSSALALLFVYLCQRISMKWDK